MKTGDLLEFSSFPENATNLSEWVFQRGLIIEIHGNIKKFWDMTILWNDGTVSRSEYHEFEFEVMND